MRKGKEKMLNDDKCSLSRYFFTRRLCVEVKMEMKVILIFFPSCFYLPFLLPYCFVLHFLLKCLSSLSMLSLLMCVYVLYVFLIVCAFGVYISVSMYCLCLYVCLYVCFSFLSFCVSVYVCVYICSCVCVCDASKSRREKEEVLGYPDSRYIKRKLTSKEVLPKFFLPSIFFALF